MKLLAFDLPNEPSARRYLGAVLEESEDEGSHVIELQATYGEVLRRQGVASDPRVTARAQIPADLNDLIRIEDGLKLAHSVLAQARKWARDGLELKAGDGRPLAFRLDEVHVQPPIPRPGKILAAGRNYAEHLDEGRTIWAERGTKVVETPPFPSGFVKLPSALTGPYDPIIYPPGVTQLDYEIELAAVIGKPALGISEEEALEHIAGYAVFNDVSARDIQLSEMEHVSIVMGKSFPSFAPMGPYLVTTDDIPDPQSLDLKLWVNGDLRQDANTAGMLFSVAEIVAYWSQVGLMPGDVISTGSPAGVALAMRPDPTPYFLRVGDVVEAEITGLGRTKHTVVGGMEKQSQRTVELSR